MSGTVQAIVDGFCSSASEEVALADVDLGRWFSDVRYRDDLWDSLPEGVRRRLGMSAISIYFGAKAVG